ncbi:hypothetical protein DUNSADRAFT_2220 [Dunaliella salina]|uniref:Uncharacterized protein n=1 Tax=Dunaliella salina TaxID=3046 RepID=A0ABQ7FWK1_DUNSA|nr:hypothetical protein DUNSADRAFT_2220 [Dunaliella salina]|eukprot:KAF5826734.1 hypothetical protein DUNSADRAFT_2220 [Dunaliella salina]
MQVAGGVAILYSSSSSSSKPTEGRWFTGGKCAIEPCDMCTTLAALAVLTVFSGFLIKATKVTLACVCPRAGEGIDSEKVVEIVARCALAFGWLFLATAVTISLNQVEMHEQYIVLDAGHQPHPAADDSNSLVGHQPLNHVDHQALLFYLLWIMAFMSLGLAVLAVASACCLACCCCCCNPDTLCAWAPCAAMCCFCCSEGGRDDCCCCSPLWCAEMLCLGWLVRKLWWQPDPHCAHTRHHCHHHDPPYHPPMPPPPPAQVVVHGGSDYYGPPAGLKEPLLAPGSGIGV